MTVRGSLCALLLLACGFAAGLVFIGQMRAEEQAIAQVAPAPAAPRGTAAAPAAVAAALPDFSRVAERTIPAVVNISSTQVVRRRLSPLEEYLYGGRFNSFGSRSIENSLGSGVIVTTDGYILTNNHVATGDGGASLDEIEISVTLSDKREMPAKVVGIDRGTDLALLKVEARNLPVIPWGDSERIKVAEWVLAIGNPYQLSETVTLGIVSAVNRTNVGINDFENFIQTDAAINPGNSGGALITATGELIGINTAIFSQSGGYQGIGFAVASNLARQIMNDLRMYGEVRRGTIRAIALRPVTPRLAQQLGATPTTQGVVVENVAPNSSAARADIQRGDIIVGYNGQEITEGRQFIRLIGESPIGSTAQLVVIRGGRRVELRVPIEQQPVRR